MVLQCCNGVGSNPVEGRNLTALKSNSNTVWFNFQTYIYIGQGVLKFFLIVLRRTDRHLYIIRHRLVTGVKKCSIIYQI